MVENEESFFVLGSGAVYVVDASGITHSNVADASRNDPLSIYDVRLHVLSQGDDFDLRERRPGALTQEEAATIQVKLAETAGADTQESTGAPLTV